MSVRRSGDGLPPIQTGVPVANGERTIDPAQEIGSGGQREAALGGNQEARVCDRIPFSSASHQSLEKLKGREDYAAWAFGMRMVMIKEGTWRAVNSPDDVQISEDLSDRALATICLSIERYNYSLVQNARTAKEAWHSLRTAFQDSGKYRKISLLRKLMRMELEDCSSVEEYVDEILTTSQKLQEIGFPLDDEWMSLILMMGLPKRYEPMVMGMDASGIKWTADWVKSKILQDVTIEPGARVGGSSGALATCPKRVSKKKDKSATRCFKCEQLGHYASECPQKSGNKSEKAYRNVKKKALLACKKQNGSQEEWILDSGAGDHMCRDQSVLAGAKQLSQTIFVADASEIPVVAIGNVEIDADIDGECCSLDVSNVLCVPDLAVNLLSVSRICKKGYSKGWSLCTVPQAQLRL